MKSNLRFINMTHHTANKRYAITLLVMLFALVQEAWGQTKTTPTVSFSPSEATAILGEQSFQAPTVTISDPSTSNRIRKYFRVTYSMDNGHRLLAADGVSDSLDTYGHNLWIDATDGKLANATTGTIVNEYSGAVTIGNKAAGSLKITATANPSALGENTYTSGTGSYTLNIKSPKDFTLHVPYNGSDLTSTSSLNIISAKLKKNQWSTDTKVVSNSVVLSPLQVTYDVNGRNVTATSDFDIKNATITTGNTAVTVTTLWDKDNKNITGYSIESTSEADLSNVSITFTVVPTTNGKKKFGESASATFTFNVNVKYYDGTNLTEDTKIKTYIEFPTREIKKYRYPTHTDPIPQIPVIYDENGNDVTQYYQLDWPMATWTGQRSYQYSDNPFDKGQNFTSGSGQALPGDYTGFDYTSDHLDDPTYGVAMYNSDPTSVSNTIWWPDDYVISLNYTLKGSYSDYDMGQLFATTPLKTERPGGTLKKQTVQGQFYSVNNANAFDVEPGEYVERVYTRCAQIKLKPNPEDVEFAENYVMKDMNRFQITAPFTPEDGIAGEEDSLSYAGLDNHDMYWYGIFVPDKYKYDGTNHPGAEGDVTIEVDNFEPSRTISDLKIRVPVYDDLTSTSKKPTKTGEYETITGTMYVATKGFNQAFDHGWSMIFHGTGHVPLYYYTFPWNPQKWDRSSYSASMFTVVQSENVTLKIDPKEYTIAVGGTSPAPKVWVEDQYGEDISKYFDFTWTTTQNGSTDNPTVEHDNTAHTSVGKHTGDAIFTITAKKKDENDAIWSAEGSVTYGIYNNPTNQVTHTIHVKGDKILYEVIYDKNYYKLGTDGNIENDQAKKDVSPTDASTADETHPIPYRKHARTSKMGKLHFINTSEDYATVAADFYPGQSEFGETPGLNIVFGNGSDGDAWQVIHSSLVTDAYDGTDFDTHGAIFVQANPAQFGTTASDQNPVDALSSETPYLVSGGCLQLTPTTNGYLQIDGNYGTAAAPVKYFLTDVTNTKSLITDVVTRPSSIGSAPAADGEYNSTSEAVDVPQLKSVTVGGDEYIYGDRRFRYALFAGHTYYLYSDAATFKLHGLTFMPGYVFIREDNNSAHRATIFADNGFSGDLPMVVRQQTDNVTFSKTWDEDTWPASYTPDGGTTQYANNIIEIKNGYQIVGKSYTRSKRVRVRASVKGIDRTNDANASDIQKGQVERAPYIDVAVVGIPIYKVGEDFQPVDPGERVSTTNFVTRIWMTWGGWEKTDQSTYPYHNHNNLDEKEIADAWGVSQTDSVGMDGKTIDGFRFASGATQNPVDEIGHAWKYNASNGEISNTFNLPVRGGYVKFEPEESGTLMVYILQNGLTDMIQNDTRKQENSANELRRRPVYLIDEKGSAVDIKDESTTWGSGTDISSSFSENEATQSSHADYMTEGINRCQFENNPLGKTFVFKPRWKGSYSSDAKGQAAFDADTTKVIKNWSALGTTNEVIRLSDSSFVVPTKSYVRYTFEVKSGKTYYVFATGSKLNFCGFAFVPNGFMNNRTKDEDWPAINEDGTVTVNGVSMSVADARKNLPEPSDSKYSHAGAGTGVGFADQTFREGSSTDTETNKIVDSDASFDADKATLGKASVNFVNVTINRTFKNSQWTSICLPFSVNQYQVEELFGEDVELITFDSVMTKHTEYADFYKTTTKDVEARSAAFTRHVNHLIEAGRPYFIRPAWDEKTTEKSNIKFEHVSLEAIDAKKIICNNTNAQNNVKWAQGRLEKNTNKEITLSEDSVNYYTALKNDKAIYTYGFQGIYDRDHIPWYSYVMGTKDGVDGLYRIVPSDGHTTSDEQPYMKGFRAYLYPVKNSDGTDVETNNPAKIQSMWLTGAFVVGDAGNTSDIEELVAEVNSMLTVGVKGVFNLQGQMVRKDNSLDGLPHGVYIMNGKKYLVK